jgi:DNA-binding response OmpR family regulator
VSRLLLLTDDLRPSAELLPALGLLTHQVRVLPADPTALLDAPEADAVLVDATTDLGHARSVCRLLRTTGLSAPLLVVCTEGGLAALTADWGLDDVLLTNAGPAEVETRLRLAIGRAQGLSEDGHNAEIRAGDVVIDEGTYSARVRGQMLDLTYKEFELLKYLAQHPGRVFTRAQLLQEVWGYDYFGGTRTVDVHVRRLRAKLGPDADEHIGTVRNVGYRFVPQTRPTAQRGQPSRPGGGQDGLADRPGSKAGDAAGSDGDGERGTERGSDRPGVPATTGRTGH